MSGGGGGDRLHHLWRRWGKTSGGVGGLKLPRAVSSSRPCGALVTVNLNSPRKFPQSRIRHLLLFAQILSCSTRGSMQYVVPCETDATPQQTVATFPCEAKLHGIQYFLLSARDKPEILYDLYTFAASVLVHLLILRRTY